MIPEILNEIQDLKQILAKVIGTTFESPENRFSIEALDRAAKEFHKWSIERGDWVPEDKIGQYIKSAPYSAGAVIRKEFEFANWFRKGPRYLYSKKDLIALAKELSDRNIDLQRYAEFLGDKAAFDRKQAKAAAAGPAAKNTRSRPYKIPAGLKNITTGEIPKPDPEKARRDLAMLKEEYKRTKLNAYIDIYKGTYAMIRNIYPYTKYIEPGLLRQCRKWVNDFNLANDVLHKITGKKEKFQVDQPGEIEL